MTRRDRLYIAVLVLAVAAALAVEVFKPVPIDWTFSFEREDPRPYGSLILYDLLPALFPGAAVHAVDLPPYLVARDTARTGVNYLFITDRFAPDPAEADALLAFAARGNHVFLAAHVFSGPFADTLRLETAFTAVAPPGPPGADTVVVNFVNPVLRAADGFVYREGAAARYFNRFDTLRATVLGVDSHDRVHFVRVAHGAGAFFLSTLPLAFTNYYMLYRGDAGYVYRALSYLPVQAVLWDAYYKPNRVEATTPLRFVLQDPALRWAYRVLAALVVLLLVFETKRRQRVVPVIEPIKNTTLEFVKTVGRLYFHHGDHANLAEKKITYLLDYIRRHLRLSTNRIDDDFIARVAERSGVPQEEVRAVFACVRAVRGRAPLPEADLRRLNALIETFYRKSTR